MELFQSAQNVCTASGGISFTTFATLFVIFGAAGAVQFMRIRAKGYSLSQPRSGPLPA
ncbi:hypothetical protein [Nitratireductor luteus]|uniref:hypothetical protein n=1 Tax=Nitratireductor luteus TaxID=2976980 RepID=UPI0022401835|nr:hypothetical protein [Nitratireductor luteus]